MMKKTIFSVLILQVALMAHAQTLNVETGSVIYQIPAVQAGEMIYENGKTVTILGKVFTLTDINQIYIDDAEVTDNTVNIHFNGSAAQVLVAGNVAKHLSVNVTGAHVSITQDNSVNKEIIYQLSGTSADGSFYMDGEYKATVELCGLTLTNPSGAAIDIQNGKRIEMSIKKDTENTLTDGANGSQKAALYCKGHLELMGKGSLTVYGNTAHAIKSAEYMQLKNCTVQVKKAVKDGISCDEYFLMESGSLTVSGTGDDAIQCDIDGTATTGQTDDHEGEDSGNIYIEGGTLTLTTTAAGTKCIKSDGTVIVSDGTLTLNASGSVDTSDKTDPSYVAGIRAEKFVQNGGAIGMTIKGTAGRGITGDNIETNGGELTINNSAAPTTISNDVKSAKGLTALNIALNAGTISITMTGNAGKGIVAGTGTKTTSGSGRPGPGGNTTKWTNVKGSYTQGLADGTGPTLTVSTTGSEYSSSTAKAIKAICTATLYGGTTEISTKNKGGEGLESKTSVDIRGGKHYFQCYDDCINSVGKIFFNGGVAVCYSNGNDAVDSNAGTTGAITIGNGIAFAYTTKGSPEEGFDCDNNSYIQITGTGIGISAGGSQGGGGGWGSSGSGNTISGAVQGYYFATNSISYQTNRYYTLADAQGNNLITYSFVAACNSTLALFTATGMTKNSKYNVKYSSTAPTDATTMWHGLYIGTSATGTSSVTTFTAK